MSGNVKCEIPPDMLRYTVSALDDLRACLETQARKPGTRDDVAAELLNEAAKALEAANFYHERYMQYLFPETAGEAGTA